MICIGISTVFLILGLCTNALSVETRKDYTGYQVLEVQANNEHDLKYLFNLLLTDNELYFGTRPSHLGRPVHIMAPPERLTELTDELIAAGLSPRVYIQNVQSILEPLYAGLTNENGKRIFDLNNFNTLVDINSWLISMVSQCRTGLTCQVTGIGNSFENRPVNVFRISKSGSNRKAIYVDATTQSSDWISTSTALHIINALATGSNAAAIRLTDDYDWHIIPVVNPDGYVYTYENDRFWLKNRRPNGQCYGTNLNVNFDARWGEEGVSHSPCNNEFCGTGAASEPETRLIQNELRRLAPSLRAALTLHSYGNMWTFSFGYTLDHAGAQCSYSVDHSNMLRVANVAADAVQATYGAVWERGTVCEILGPVSGISADFTKESAGVYNTFSLNLRGDGFVLDKSEIGPAFNEVWNGIVAMVNAIETK